MNLHGDLQKSLSEAGYLQVMPVQGQVLQQALEGADVYVQSQTGTGKTAAYLIVMMQRMLTDPLLKGKKALIMVPTRELAVQVEDEAKVIGKYLPFRTASFFGGVGYGAQQASLRADAEIMVGTPGRVLDLCSSGMMNLFELAFLVLDEADRMFDMGFYPDLRKLIQLVPPKEKRQTMLFSATLNVYVKNLALEYTKEPVEIEIEPEKVTVEEISQFLYHVSSEDKFRLLLGLLEREKPQTALVFCNTKRYTEIVSRRLFANGYSNEYISGDLPQIKRLKIIENMKAGKTPLLIATDVAARGLDIEGLDLVVNYDLPTETENYVHRIGRTARAGKSGKAITFASEQDVYELAGIEKFIGMKIPSEVAKQEDFGEDAERRGAARQNRRGGREGFFRRERPFSGERREYDGERRENENAPRVPKSRTPRPPKLSALSPEERAAYYREKYEKNGMDGGEQPERQAEIPAGRGIDKRRAQGSRPSGDRQYGDRQYVGSRRGERPTGGERYGERPHGEGRYGGDGEGRGGRYGERQSGDRQYAGGRGGRRRGEGAAQNGAERAKRGAKGGRNAVKCGMDTGGAKQKSAKPGLLSRIIGLFKKKTD